MSDPNRPWWADREVVEFWVEQRAFDATLAYLDGLAGAVEQKIAYAADDPAVAAKQALADLDRLWHGDRLVVARMAFDESAELLLTVGDDGVNAHLAAVEQPRSYQADDPAHVMVCACSHGYTDHSDVGCSHCPHCSSFKYSHDDERASGA
ncbi:hypothetical protein SEA_ELLIE_52 [Mycobacterium phage Ellie]|uniref:Uncharacterized protein n=1 Tax=Mycobacterium phage Ellie TaxID=2762405 RepID=A0A7G8LM05_9CAUD|nr:hypothetical protein I5G88_gp52 [Mycobacterium phage Ellie]QNJ58277.1 hypothetical protein SEA_ELLIE_52 [Mycobacterium phage Ellie]QTF82053.1 hypothetical protein SEA_FEFFERHEAD_54 [Mycobacterium phage Fefferhead]